MENKISSYQKILHFFSSKRRFI